MPKSRGVKTGPQQFPLSSASLADARAVLETALTSEHGVKLVFESDRARITFRQRIYTARKRDREQTLAVYPPENPMHGKSSYDSLAVFFDDTNSEPGHHIMLVHKPKHPFGCISIEPMSEPLEEE